MAGLKRCAPSKAIRSLSGLVSSFRRDKSEGRNRFDSEDCAVRLQLLIPMRWKITIAVALAASFVAYADERMTAKEARPLDPTASNIVGQFHQVGFPKYTDLERQVIERAQKEQDEQAAIYERVGVGKSVFDYPGLIALGPIRYDPSGPIPYSLTIGIRPHNSEFAKTFGEYRIEIDEKGVIQGKSKVQYSSDNAELPQR